MSHLNAILYAIVFVPGAFAHAADLATRGCDGRGGWKASLHGSSLLHVDISRDRGVSSSVS